MPEQATKASGHVPTQNLSALSLAALGVVFGDIGTSPLYTLKTVLDLMGHHEPRAVLGALSLVVAVVTAFITFFVGQALLGSHHTTLGSPHVLRAVFGAALYLTMLCLFAAGVTAMLHNQTLALGVLVPFFFLLSPILSAVPKVRTLAHYFPDYAGSRMLLVYEEANQPYGPWPGFLICLAWTLAALLGGALVLRRRDA